MLTINKRNELILSHMPLADKIAFYKKGKVPYFIDVDELKSAAYFGLVDAACKYNPKYKSFAGYASIRISGSICDFLRSLGWGSKCQYTVIFCDEDSPLDSWKEADPEDDWQSFKDVIKKLDKIEQQVLMWYYGEGYNMREIGDKLDVSESRISQIIKRCKILLKRQWEDKKDELY